MAGNDTEVVVSPVDEGRDVESPPTVDDDDDESQTKADGIEIMEENDKESKYNIDYEGVLNDLVNEEIVEVLRVEAGKNHNGDTEFRLNGRVAKGLLKSAGLFIAPINGLAEILMSKGYVTRPDVTLDGLKRSIGSMLRHIVKRKVVAMATLNDGVKREEVDAFCNPIILTKVRRRFGASTQQTGIIGLKITNQPENQPRKKKRRIARQYHLSASKLGYIIDEVEGSDGLYVVRVLHPYECSMQISQVNSAILRVNVVQSQRNQSSMPSDIKALPEGTQLKRCKVHNVAYADEVIIDFSPSEIVESPQLGNAKWVTSGMTAYGPTLIVALRSQEPSKVVSVKYDFGKNPFVIDFSKAGESSPEEPKE